jgi:hypothetical protein
MDKSLVFSVSAYAGCYRHIQISENATLFMLHDIINNAFDFDDDHMHAFFMNNRAWDDREVYMCPSGDLDNAKDYTDHVKLSELHLEKGDKFLYIFDFGDEWRFQIKILRVINEQTKSPVMLKSIGTISQYGDDGDF